MTITSRQIAYRILNDIYFQKRSLDEAFARAEGFEALEGRDRGFVRLLVSVVLKRSNEMDDVLQSLLHEPLESLKPPQMINIFRLGMAQFAFLDTKAHAVVDTCVELAADEGIAHHKPFVNAVMRRLTREGFPHVGERDAGRINTPEWLWQQWLKDYGVEAALEIAAGNLGEAAVDFTIKALHQSDITPEQWAEKLGAVLLPTGSLRVENSGFVPALEGYDAGVWWVQSAAAALPAKLLSGFAGKTVIDLCAAPGGKTAQLASDGAIVTALDRSAERMKRLQENMQRLNLTVETVTADGAVWKPRAPVDAVLLDAPCTATGTIRHQPDVLHLKEMRDQEKMAALQRRLLLNAADMLKPGGVLVYCTCSIQKAEGEDQTDWFLSERPDMQLVPISTTDIPGIAGMLTMRGEIRCLPCHWRDRGGIDGFYVARFVRQ